MTESDTKLRRVFRQALGLPADAAVDALTYRGVKEWDSIAHMQLVAALETEFNVSLDTSDVIGMSSFSVARDTLARLGVQFGG